MSAPQQQGLRGLGRWRRLAARVAVLVMAGMAMLFISAGPASADDKCSDWEWHNVPQKCVKELDDEPESTCKTPPVASAPDSGMAGWFASDKLPDDSSVRGQYTKYGYAGYALPTYDLGCTGEMVPDQDSAGNSLAGLELTLASGIIGASNGLREAAWEPSGMWGWADKLVEDASSAIFEKVFTVFGAITVGLVGLYLIWRSRQADMSMAVTTAGWAILILVVVTAVARWPVESATFADQGLTSSLGVVQTALGPPEEDCEGGGDCDDTRSPALRASDMATGEILYANWIRSVLGQSEEVSYEKDSDGGYVKDEDGNPSIKGTNTAYKYGPALYAAGAFSWSEIKDAREDPDDRRALVAEKEQQWRNIAAQIEKEDPEAYQALTGQDGWDRAGTGLLAVLSALFFALFDITASVLIILGFLLIRWAVIAMPLIGTIAILRPASGGFKRLVSAVLAAVINVVVFGVAAAVYLYAVSQVLAANIPGWLQVILIALIGAAAWMLLRPYRRVGSLKGGTSLGDAAFGRRRTVVKQKTVVSDKTGRPEDAAEESIKPSRAATGKESREPLMAQRKENTAAGGGGSTLPPRPAPGGGSAVSDTGSRRTRPGYSVYRPSTTGSGAKAGDRPLVAVRPD